MAWGLHEHACQLRLNDDTTLTKAVWLIPLPQKRVDQRNHVLRKKTLKWCADVTLPGHICPRGSAALPGGGYTAGTATAGDAHGLGTAIASCAS